MSTSAPNRTLDSGRLILALAFLGFGIHSLVFVFKPSLPPPGPPWFHLPRWFCAVIGAIQALAGLGLAIPRAAQRSAILLGVVLLIIFFGVDLPQVAHSIRNPGPWTSAAEMLFMAAGAVTLVRPGAMTGLARVLFALPLVVFGVQHLMYPRFVASLVPSWLPAHYFWVIFFGVGFLAAAGAVLVRVADALAASLVGLTYILWFLVLHIPLVVQDPSNGKLWTSAFVALACSGTGFIAAGICQRVERSHRRL